MELQRGLNVQLRQISYAKVKAMVGKTWDPTHWMGTPVYFDSPASALSEHAEVA